MDGVGIVITKRVIVPRAPAVRWTGSNNGGARAHEQQRGEENQEVRRRREGQRVRPSSKASRKAAFSSFTSDDSQPPFGTAGILHVSIRKLNTRDMDQKKKFGTEVGMST